MFFLSTLNVTLIEVESKTIQLNVKTLVECFLPVVYDFCKGLKSD